MIEVLKHICFIFRPNQECQKIFKAQYPIDVEQSKAKVCTPKVFFVFKCCFLKSVCPYFALLHDAHLHV